MIDLFAAAADTPFDPAAMAKFNAALIASAPRTVVTPEQGAFIFTARVMVPAKRKPAPKRASAMMQPKPATLI